MLRCRHDNTWGLGLKPRGTTLKIASTRRTAAPDVPGAMQQTALYIEASTMMQEGNYKAALATFSRMSLPEKSSYYGLVLLRISQAQQGLAQEAEMQKTLAILARRNDVYGDIGKVMLHEAAVADKNAPLYFTRAEWAAWDMAGKGDNAAASAAFAALAASKTTPATLRERAAMMANYLKH